MEFEGNDQRSLVRTLSGRLDDLLNYDYPRPAGAGGGAGGGGPSAEEDTRPSMSEDVSVLGSVCGQNGTTM